MMKITPYISIDENELDFTFIRANGPGGQNINKVSTAVQLRFDIANSPSLPEEAKKRLIKLAGKRAAKDQILSIEAKRYRTQEHNKEDAIERFRKLVLKALEVPKPRKQTSPTQVSQEERLKKKKQRGAIKRMRSKLSEE
jgi:ribosome-associated protein